MSKEILISKLKEVSKELKVLSDKEMELYKKKSDIEDALFEEVCPYKIGGKFTTKTGITVSLTSFRITDDMQLLLTIRGNYYYPSPFTVEELQKALDSKELLPYNKDAPRLAPTTKFKKVSFLKYDKDGNDVLVCFMARGKCAVVRTHNHLSTDAKQYLHDDSIEYILTHADRRISYLRFQDEEVYLQIPCRVIGVYKDYKELTTQYLI